MMRCRLAQAAGGTACFRVAAPRASWSAEWMAAGVRSPRTGRRAPGGSAPLRCSVRGYTPIWAPDAPEDHLGSQVRREEARALWAKAIPIPTVQCAIEAWLRMGNDPVLHTALPARGAAGGAAPSATASESPFAYVEDYMGTNLVTSSPEHLKDSIHLWSSFFDRKYCGIMRQSRRTVANHVGTVNAPEVFTDEADRPGSTWAQDSYFREVAFLAEKHLKERVTNLEQFERALLRAAPQAYLDYHDSFSHQTNTLIPLPSPSVWHFTADRRKVWAEAYCALQKERLVFFEVKVAAALKRAPQEKIVALVAGVFREVAQVQKKRRARQLAEGVGGTLQPWETLSAAEKLQCAQHEVDMRHRSVVDGDFDPEDSRDTSEQWISEQLAINEIMTKEIGELGFSAMDFWKHTLRFEEFETEHIHSEPRIRAISAAAVCELYDTMPFDAVVDAGVEAIQEGHLDARAGVFRPHTNDAWCKMNYAKFGSSTVVHHTHTASRILHYYHASSLQEVVAAATLYYKSKPLSAALDYGTPYNFRRSMALLCSAYGVDMAHAAQRPFIASAAHMARAEGLIHSVVRHVAKPYGERRRRLIDAQCRANIRHLVPVKGVVVTDLVSDDAEPSSASKSLSDRLPVDSWLLGSVKSVFYDWPVHHHERLRVLLAGGSEMVACTAQNTLDAASLRSKANCEISLWRKKASTEVAAAVAAEEASARQVVTAIASIPQLREIQAYATRFFDRVEVTRGAEAGEGPASNETDSQSDEWEFAVMLDDRSFLNVPQRADLYLPFTDAAGVPLKQGEYRLRLRAFDAETNPNRSPAACVETFSKPFVIFDALPQLTEQFFGSTARVSDVGKASTFKTLEGSDLIPFCQFLRDAGLDIPLSLEFEAGQTLDANGNVILDHLLALIRGGTYHKAACQARLTEAQRSIEVKVRAHWEVHNPGATAEEWAAARRTVLDYAINHEREWWLPDGMLETEMSHLGTNVRFCPSTYPSTCRYSLALCLVLSAEAASGDGNPHDSRSLQAVARVDGTGTPFSLDISAPPHAQEGSLTVDNVLKTALESIRRAQDRHNTLAALKTSNFDKQTQADIFCSLHGLEFGGKYARTYCYAFNRAKQELAEDSLSGRTVSQADRDAGLRTDEKQEVDRFASSTHPEQRRNLFVARSGPGGYNLDDPQPSNSSTWGQ